MASLRRPASMGDPRTLLCRGSRGDSTCPGYEARTIEDRLVTWVEMESLFAIVELLPEPPVRRRLSAKGQLR